MRNKNTIVSGDSVGEVTFVRVQIVSAYFSVIRAGRRERECKFILRAARSTCARPGS